jgi:hypothetical protein
MYPEGIGIRPTMIVGHYCVGGQCVKPSMDKSMATAKLGSTHNGFGAKRLLAATPGSSQVIESRSHAGYPKTNHRAADSRSLAGPNGEA